MNSLRRFFALITIIFTSWTAWAQNNSNSPYSYYGIGLFDRFNYSRTAGMGGTSLALKSGSFLNSENPASYASIDSLHFLLDVTANANVSRFESKLESYTVFDGNFKRIEMGFRLLRGWGVSLGFKPFTHVGYKVMEREPIAGLDGANAYSIAQYSGEGGLSKIYFGTAIRLFNHVALGVNASMILGYFNKTKASTITELDATWYEKYRYKPATSFNFDFGLQFWGDIAHDVELAGGLVAGLHHRHRLVEYLSVSTSLNGVEDMRSVTDFYTPMFCGAGLSLKTNKWTFAADYRIELWDNLLSDTSLMKAGKTHEHNHYYHNAHHASVGVEFCPDRYLGRTVFQRMTYQAGLHFDRTGLMVLNRPYDMYGISLGVVIPFRMQLSSLSLSVDLGTKGQKSKSLFRENYFRFNIGICFSDFWFMKRQYD